MLMSQGGCKDHSFRALNQDNDGVIYSSKSSLLFLRHLHQVIYFDFY